MTAEIHLDLADGKIELVSGQYRRFGRLCIAPHTQTAPNARQREALHKSPTRMLGPIKFHDVLDTFA
jgi:hypothetical protein